MGGRRTGDIRPSTSESQEIDAERIRKHKEEVAEQMRIRALVEGDKDEALEEYAEKYLKPKDKTQPFDSSFACLVT